MHCIIDHPKQIHLSVKAGSLKPGTLVMFAERSTRFGIITANGNFGVSVDCIAFGDHQSWSDLDRDGGPLVIPLTAGQRITLEAQ